MLLLARGAGIETYDYVPEEEREELLLARGAGIETESIRERFDELELLLARGAGIETIRFQGQKIYRACCSSQEEQVLKLSGKSDHLFRVRLLLARGAGIETCILCVEKHVSELLLARGAGIETGTT